MTNFFLGFLAGIAVSGAIALFTTGRWIDALTLIGAVVILGIGIVVYILRSIKAGL